MMAAVKVTTTVLTAAEARPRDVVMTADASVYQYEGDGQWSQMELALSESGPWSPLGELVLLVRDGKPAVIATPASRGLP